MSFYWGRGRLVRIERGDLVSSVGVSRCVNHNRERQRTGLSGAKRLVIIGKLKFELSNTENPMKKLVVIALLAFLQISISAQTAKMSKSDEKSAAAIRQVMEDQDAAWNRGDIDGFMQGYWKSEQLIFVSSKDVTRGWQGAIDRYKKTYDSRAKMGTLSFSGLEITVLSKDSAVVLGNWALKRESDNPGGKFTLIFRKFKDGWKIVHDHTS